MLFLLVNAFAVDPFPKLDQKLLFDSGGAADADTGRDIAVDASGNVYAIGTRFVGGFTDIQAVKFSSTGSVLWSQTIATTILDTGKAIAVDSSGNVFTAGDITDSVQESNWQVNKLDPNGTSLVEIIYDGAVSKGDFIKDITVDDAGNVIFTGQEKIQEAFDKYSITTIKYNNSLTAPLWIEKFDLGESPADVQNIEPTKIVTDSSNNVYVSGFVLDGAGVFKGILLKYSSFSITS